MIKAGDTVRYVGNSAPLAGMEGKVLEIRHEDALIRWATHERAYRQKGERSVWHPSWEHIRDLKKIGKLTKGFSYRTKDGP